MEVPLVPYLIVGSSKSKINAGGISYIREGLWLTSAHLAQYLHSFQGRDAHTDI